MTDVTAERLKELLHYGPETGVFTNRTTRWRAKAGGVAGHVCSNGYRQIRIDRKIYYAHRLAFLYMTGAWPPCEVDHKNLVRGDNKWVNLRLATQSENQGNTNLNTTNTSGYKGVSWNRRVGKWRADIGVHGKVRTIGYFATRESAHAAYLVAAQRHFGEFARSGT